MSFTPKAWEDLPSLDTPLSAEALIDLENRLAAYSGSLVAVDKSTAGANDVLYYDGTAGKFVPRRGAHLNVRAFGAQGDGITDDTAALQAALNAASAAGGGVVLVPAGTYMASALSLSTNVSLIGESRSVSTLKANGLAPAGSAFLSVPSQGVTIAGLKIDGAGAANLSYGLYVTGNGTDKHFLLRDCRVQGFTWPGDGTNGEGQALWSWTSDYMVLEGNEWVNNFYDISLDTPGPHTRIVGNTVWSESGFSDRRVGIMVSTFSSAWVGCLIANNSVHDAVNDAAGNGVEGHGINVYNCQGVRVVGNTVTNCVTANIHVGSGAFGTKVIGNSTDGGGTGVYVEVNFGTSVLPTDGTLVAAIVADNSVRGTQGYGIAVSYGPGTIVRGNHISNCLSEGIITDSDHVVIDGNVVFDNYTSDAAPSPGADPNVQAQIRVYISSYCRVTGNQVFTTAAPGTLKADYAIAIDDGKHIIKDNTVVGGGTVGGIYQSASTTNIAADNIEA